MISKQFGEEFLNRLNLESKRETQKKERKQRGDGERRREGR